MVAHVAEVRRIPHRRACGAASYDPRTRANASKPTQSPVSLRSTEVIRSFGAHTVVVQYPHIENAA